MTSESDVRRLENLWAQEFGDEYVDRNREVGSYREPLWRRLHETYGFTSVLEVGCNLGANLQWLARLLDPLQVYGVDINAKALREARSRLPDVNAVYSPARSLPFRDARFDLVFCAGVLIHQPPEALPVVMSEMVRCSRRYVLCGEYYSEEPVEVPYRGERGALYKRDYGGLFASLFGELQLVERWSEGDDDSGWDRSTWWVFEKNA